MAVYRVRKAPQKETPNSSHSTPTRDQEDTDRSTPSPTVAQVEEYKHVFATGFKLVSIVTGVTISYYLLFLNLAIISTATLSITSEFDSLTDMAFQPLSGKIYRYFPLSWSFIAFFFVFELGSAICGAARSSNMFIVGRAIAGLGSSGLFTGTITITSNTLPLQRRPLVMGINMGIGQLGLACGPILGEATVKPHWRDVLSTAIKSLDLTGFALISPAATMFLLALEYGGNQYAWNSSVVVFVSMGSPLVADFYLAIFFQAIQNDSALMSDVHMLPMTLGMVLFTMFTGAITQVTGYYLPWVLAGSCISAIGYGLLSTLNSTTSTARWVGYQILYSAGSGIGNSGVSCFALSYSCPALSRPNLPRHPWAYITIQNLVHLKQIPTAIAIVIFTQNLGGATWIVVANSIFNNSLRKQLSRRASRFGLDPDVIVDTGASSLRNLSLSASQLAAVLESYGTSIDHAMYLGIAVAGGMLLSAWGLGFENVLEIKRLKELTNDNNKREAEPAPEDQATEKRVV
ncbi:major facilitator superfamily domain-containing protein [Talaromyces proteolyticus]|uniref:Major facilitator superfamily domain-containing protein n=1 Tax=Talaromyces proteolyticus TaxID=1131652 RepID=A0AAD4KLJ2_9EURO|nr:major facilitator superfamily domain-containing protein [Talaromyces proteolyticus]KAH8693876.1 major facilitator superfamily domain-containing protein [Talaromyces proteolyticus]